MDAAEAEHAVADLVEGFGDASIQKGGPLEFVFRTGRQAIAI